MSTTNPSPLPTGRTKVIACATVIEEMLPMLPASITYELLDFGLHLVPKNLKQALQEAIDRVSPEADTIILGYGLCSLAVIGLHARTSTLVVPKVDDCISIFLGSGAAYSQQAKSEPGTYYLTKGWIEVSDTLMDEQRRVVEKYGEKRAAFIMGEMLKHYKRLVYIDTGTADQEKYRAYARNMAEHFNLRFEEIPGDNSLIRKMVEGDWNEEFVVTPPGGTISYVDFK